ncbi:MAG: hypothetical protein AAF965_01040 [Pseudomonadota bacterium]
MDLVEGIIVGHICHEGRGAHGIIETVPCLIQNCLDVFHGDPGLILNVIFVISGMRRDFCPDMGDLA